MQKKPLKERIKSKARRWWYFSSPTKRWIIISLAISAVATAIINIDHIIGCFGR